MAKPALYPSEDLYPASSLYPSDGASDAAVQRKPRHLIPKLRIPLEMGALGLRTVEQDSVDEVAACAYAVLATPRGARLEEPDFGVEEPVFEELPVDTEEWIDALAEWEPRAEVETTQEVEELVGRVNVEVAAR